MTKHPATLCKDRVQADGTIRPLSIEEQHKQEDVWYAFLESDRADERPVLSSFNAAWEELDAMYAINGRSIMHRGSSAGTAKAPLAALFHYVEMGFYPPPELLLTLYDCWQTYEAASGHLPLEQAFFGPAKKGVGNYAGRRSGRLRIMHMQWEFARHLHEGKTRAQAAEIISLEHGGKPDADSILRMFRGFSGLRARPAREEK
jgi:hypothetical protein